MQNQDYFTISSVQFPNVYLRMDGSSTTGFEPGGSGTVNCQFTAHSWERFKIVSQSNGSVTIESAVFPGVFLRMDGRGTVKPEPGGSGIVNCQFTAHSWEHFKIAFQPNGAITFESVAFPGVFLRMDGSKTTKFEPGGSGTVNCQFGAGPYEQFHLHGPALSQLEK